MISNPARTEDGGKFTYETENETKILYHFSPYDCGLTETMDYNVVFLASGDGDARNILINMLDELVRYRRNNPMYFSVNRTDELERYLGAVRGGDVLPTVAPTNQFYKVGWADSDLI